MRVVKSLKRIQQKIDKLEENGWEVTLSHVKPHDNCPLGTTYFSAEKKGILFEGIAVCAPEDNYSKVTGTEIAFNRLLRDMSASIGRRKMQKIFN